MYLLNCILISVYKKINMKKILLVGALKFWLVPTILQVQVLEPEESESLLPGQFEVGTGLEFQTPK